VKNEALGLSIYFAAKPGGGSTPYFFRDCLKNKSFNGTGFVTILQPPNGCKIELKDPVSGKGTTHMVSVTANPCTFAGSASVKLPGSSTTQTWTDSNISNNTLPCP
jgi:hypothetical protein